MKLLPLLLVYPVLVFPLVHAGVPFFGGLELYENGLQQAPSLVLSSAGNTSSSTSDFITATVRTLCGRSFTFILSNINATVRDLQEALQPRINWAPDDQRIIFQARQLNPDDRLVDCGVVNGAEITVVQKLRGDIGVFQGKEDTVPTKFLMNSDYSGVNEPLLDALMREAQRLNAEPDGYEYIESIERELADAGIDPLFWNCTLATLSGFLDYLWEVHIKESERPIKDMKVTMSDDVFAHLVGDGSSLEEANVLLHYLHKVLWRRDDVSAPSSKLALRIVHGPTNGCIPFHIDQGSTRTLQVMLSDPDEYNGGKLCFFIYESKAEVKCLNRIKGSVSWHPRSILHGVTNLVSGTRKSLFVVDKKNALGDEVVVITEEYLADFHEYHSSLGYK